jgi:HPt (histidine-containing phosphotransfer) domain-containing protein
MSNVAAVADPPPAAAPAIDEAHLRSMTYGDKGLEHELLQLFDRQAEILVARMRTSDPAAAATLAHTLKGSAAGIGAGGVMQAAQAAEIAAARSPAELDAALDRLARAVADARTEIAALLRAH